ncbi:hypothetical protein H9647_19600 [Paenibacillus sp. Sa2BVA9]|uniref:Uncharacterized protein n=1 Tax=Paenibacillus gallinarum TaxID=2762232 RepID=A0ABR8T4R0_9BACL|nr:hypothetical protein [Paenibacillus gallinarum]
MNSSWLSEKLAENMTTKIMLSYVETNPYGVMYIIMLALVIAVLGFVVIEAMPYRNVVEYE